MRVTVLCFLVALSLHGQVVVERPKVTLASSDRMHRICGEGLFDACTRFIGYTLRATCVPHARGSAVIATASFRPWIVLHDIHRLDHEEEHIEDIRGFAEAYVRELEQEHFESEAECRATTLAAMDGFGVTMREFALRSNLMRHPSLRNARDRRGTR